MSTPLVGKNGAEALRLARELCDELQVPLVIHPGNSEVSIGADPGAAWWPATC